MKDLNTWEELLNPNDFGSCIACGCVAAPNDKYCPECLVDGAGDLAEIYDPYTEADMDEINTNLVYAALEPDTDVELDEDIFNESRTQRTNSDNSGSTTRRHDV